MRPVTNVALVLKKFIDEMKATQAFEELVFDASLMYDEAIKSKRAYKTEYNLSTVKTLPFLAWNRMVLALDDNLGLHTRQQYLAQKVGIEYPGYRGCLGQITINCMFVCNSMADAEVFELNFAIGQSINLVSNFDVAIPELGDPLKYSLYWEPITDMTLNKSSGSYITLTTSVVIRGAFLIFDQNFPALAQITMDSATFNNAMFGSSVANI